MSALQALREFLRIHEPVAQAGVVVVARAEPSVVHHEQLDPQFGGLVRQLLLPGFVDVEGGGLPRVVEHRTQPRSGAARQNLFALEAVQRARGAAEAALREAGVEGGVSRVSPGFSGYEKSKVLNPPVTRTCR